MLMYKEDFALTRVFENPSGPFSEANSHDCLSGSWWTGSEN